MQTVCSNTQQIPNEILCYIFWYLPPFPDFFTLQQASKAFKLILEEMMPRVTRLDLWPRTHRTEQFAYGVYEYLSTKFPNTTHLFLPASVVQRNVLSLFKQVKEVHMVASADMESYAMLDKYCPASIEYHVYGCQGKWQSDTSVKQHFCDSNEIVAWLKYAHGMN